MTEFIRVAGIRFKRAGKVYYFDPGEKELLRGDQVIVDTATGLGFGDVVVPPKDVPRDEVVLPMRKIVRKVGRDDHRRLVDNRHDERAAQEIALERIEAHGLPMRLVNAEYTFDRNRLTFFFTADNRVDFRALVHDLARQFGVRIELRQIGVRDEAKEVGGIGVCGRELCCTSWMGEFSPVSIRMAKHQSLSLNPSKLTGQCGRLKCCLKFENDTYREVRSLLPAPGDTVAVGVPPSTPGVAGVAGTPAERGPRADANVAALVELEDASHVVVQGKVREVLVTRESVDVDIGRGKRVRVSLKQIESGEAIALTGKLANQRAVSVSNGANGTLHAREEAGDAQSESAAAAEGAGQEVGTESKPARRRRRRRRRPRRRPGGGGGSR